MLIFEKNFEKELSREDKTMNKGPVAPKDPTVKRPFFYIMQDKEIYGAKLPNNTGVQFIYQNDNRLINSARIAGNVTDEEILQLLKTTEGFRKLVYAIGVSVVEETATEQVRFVYQMYGHKDTYGSGSNLTIDMIADGMENLIYLDDIEWSNDDKEPGQIRFEFANADVQASANVRFYLRDGFEAPEVIEDEEIDVESADYKKMIEKSLMQLGNTERLRRAIEKAKKGEDVTIAFIGGSITQGAGAIPLPTQCYAYRTYQSFKKLFGTGDNVHFVKAGVGGTPSQLGVIRFERDILRDGTVEPDIVVVEFAVNDEGDETKGVCYESLVRKILALPNEPAAVLLFAVFAYDWNLQDRLGPVGKKLDLPMVSILDAVVEQFRLRKGEGRVLSKNQFFYDIYHPSNAGHRIMEECLMYMFEQAAKQELMEDETVKLMEQDTVYGSVFEKIKLLDRKDAGPLLRLEEGSFCAIDEHLQGVEMDDKPDMVPQFPYNWYRIGAVEGKKDYFEMEIQCKALMLVYKDSGALNVGKADVFVDDKHVLIADPHKNGWVHCNPVILFNEPENKAHTVRIQMAQDDEDKEFTILGFGYVE